MKIPFLKHFKKGGGAAKQSPASSSQTSKPSTISKPAGERMSKTVMPNVTRTVLTEETPEAASSALNDGSSFETPTTAPRAVSFGPTKKTVVGRNKDLPPAVAFALEPRVERAISLDLADVLKEMPAGLTKPLESLDKSRRILVKASELEKKMAFGKPTLSLANLHHQAPEIFLKPIAADNTTEIALPFDKVLEAFMQMQVRRDQVSDDAVPQVETPFLQVTLEDSEKFGVPNEPLQAPTKAPARAEAAKAGTESDSDRERFMPIPATAEAIAAANPEEAAATELIRMPRLQQAEPTKPLRIPLAKQPEGKSSRASKAAPERIPFHLPPKETGAPASERVPASSGPPVSTASSAARIPFGMAPDMNVPQKTAFAPARAMNEEAGGDDRKISLALKPILQSLPVFELSGDPKEVPEDARIELSFSLIHSQLSSGRIAIAPELFERALPEGGRRFFTAKNLQVPVLLPLQEVLKNLPSDALQMRGDQEQGEVGETIETPFSTTAAEDAKRFNKGEEPTTPPEPAFPEPEPAAVPGPAPTLDAKSVVARVCALEGVSACSLCFTDGLSLAGGLPPELGAEAICTMAPSLIERIEPHLVDSKIGALQSVTLHCTNSMLTFLKHANVCLAALHTNGELTEEVRTELGRLVVELSRTYSQTGPSHVDH